MTDDLPRVTVSRATGATAGIAWVVVAMSGTWLSLENGDDWVAPYAAFSISLLVATVATVWMVAAVTHGSRRRWLRTGGVVVGGVGCVASIVAWALPLWMFLLGVGFAAIACASRPATRAAIAVLSAGQLIGIPVLIVAIEMEVGTPDEYGDYPAASAIALIFTAASMIVGLTLLSKQLASPKHPGGQGGAAKARTTAS